MATPQVGVPLPKRNGSHVRIVYPRVGFPVEAMSHSSAVVGTMMHWGEKNSFPCIKSVAECPWCKSGLRKVWYGWLFGLDRIKGGFALIQLTETAVRSSPFLSDSSIDLRGAKVELDRLADAKGSTVRAKVTVNTWKDNSRADEPDVFALLLRFYKIPLQPQATQRTEEGEGQ